MKRLRRGTRVLWVIAGLSISGCFPAPRRVIFDPFATPFAVVETRGDQSLCVLPDDGGARWTPVPPASAPGMRQAAIANVPLAPRKFDGEPTGFCVYKWADPKTLPMPEDFARIHAVPDGAVVGAREYPPSKIPDLPESVWRPLINTFEKLARDIEPGRWQDLAKRRLDHPKKPVRVAVLDTTPKNLNSFDLSLHGLGVSRVIGSLLCGDINACGDRVRPYLALPMVTARDEDVENGGLYGTFFQLYDALFRALSDWHPNDENLVINLSLGWDPIKTDESDPKVQRVKSLLERASCMGALIVAGAGNRTGTDGPVQPGSFEEFEAPDAKRCRELSVNPLPASKQRAARALSKPAYSPLLYAVGAVDSMDQRLMADRRWSQPRLAAFALNVVVPGPPGVPYTAPATGTSFATATVSGIAAAVWSVLPDLNAAEIMDVVYRGGVELDGGEKSKRARTEFCLGEHFGPCLEPNTKVHRAFLCGALKEALAQATPEEKLNCEPSIATEFPRWPTVASSGSAQICRVIDCGISHGPPSTQVAGISSHGGFAGCPGCTLNLSSDGLFGTLTGIPTPPDPAPDSGTIVSLVLSVAARKAPEIPYALSPLPAFNVQMAVPAMAMPAKTSGATLTWYYSHGDFSESDPAVDIQVVPAQ
jgi:hypothetical protein